MHIAGITAKAQHQPPQIGAHIDTTSGLDLIHMSFQSQQRQDQHSANKHFPAVHFFLLCVR